MERNTEKESKVKELTPYQEHHFTNPQDVGVAFNHDRIWVCLNGQALLRAKWICGKLLVEFTPPKSE